MNLHRWLAWCCAFFGFFLTAPPLYAAFPGANGKIAFQHVPGPTWEIYTMNPDGSAKTQLTNNSSNDTGAAWSPDGTTIAFTAERDGNSEIYRMNADGTGQTRLTNNAALDDTAAWSPDGTKIAFMSNRDGNLEIYVMNADGTGQTRLTTNAATDAEPAWSPDGTQIAFYSNRDGNNEVYKMNADGTGQIRVTNDAASDTTSQGAWSPDGAKLTFTSNRDGNNEIYVMNADGSAQTRLTTNAVSDRRPAWSPDGTKIVFVDGNDGGAAEIDVMNADGTGQTDISNLAADDHAPAWQPLSTAPCATPLANLVSWWPAESSASDIVDGNSGSMVNGATFVAGRVGQAFSLDGVNDYVEIPDAANLTPATELSLDAWVNPAAYPGASGSVILGKYHCNTGSSWTLEMSSTGQVSLSVVNFTWPSPATYRAFITVSPVLTPGVWRHVAATFDAGTQDMAIYINGSSVAITMVGGSGTVTSIYDSVVPMRIGTAVDCGGAFNYFFRGSVDEVELFNRVLTPTEIQAIYAAGGTGKCHTCTTPPANMVSWWTGDGTAIDSTGTNHGTLQNGATYAAGKVDQAFSFDGVNDYVGIANGPSLDLGTGNFTIDFWVNFNSLSSDMTLVHKISGTGTSSSDPTYFVEFDLANALRFRISNGVGNTNDLIVNTTLTTGRWYHVAAVRNGNTNTLYLDGNQIGSQTAGSSVNTGTGGLAAIGRCLTLTPSACVRYVSGQMDEVEILNRALSQTEIQAIVNAGIAGKCKPTATPTVTPTASPTSTPTSTATETPTSTPTETPTVTDTPTETPTETVTLTVTSTPISTPTSTPTSTSTLTSTSTPTNTPTPAVEPLLSYKIKAPAADLSGSPIAGNMPTANWIVTLDDVHIANNADDPQNFLLGKSKELLNAATKDGALGPINPALHYIRYDAKLGPETAGPAVNGEFPKPAKHVERIWQLTNAYGSINVLSKKAKALLVPAAADDNTAPPAPADATHYACYQVKATADITAQTPDGGDGNGKFRKDLQVFLEDPFFNDCALLADGMTPSFDNTAVEGSCLFDLKKPVELCNPVDKSEVVPPRMTTATMIDGSTAGSSKALLCYKVGLSTKYKDAAAAALAGATVGAALDPKQSKHVKRGLETNDPVLTTAGNQFPWPARLNTTKQNLACVPTDVVGVSIAP